MKNDQKCRHQGQMFCSCKGLKANRQLDKNQSKWAHKEHAQMMPGEKLQKAILIKPVLGLSSAAVLHWI